METVKRKINALKDEIERKDEGKINFTPILIPLTPILLTLSPPSPLKFPFTPNYPNFPSFAPRPKLTFIFLDITVLREKLKKEQMERERYENEANHQSRKVKISSVTAKILFSFVIYGS